jgi:hypothetical protein
MRVAVMDHDVLAIGGGETSMMAYHPVAVRLNAFHEWLASAAAQSLGGSWSTPFVERAWKSGAVAADKEIGDGLKSVSEDDRIAQLAVHEMKGIAAAIVQQVSRAADKVLNKRRPAAWLILGKAYDKASLNRTLTFCNTLTVAAHNRAKLAVYRAAGLKYVGIDPELRPKKKTLYDADTIELELDPELRSELLEEAAGGVDLEEVEILTAGDDDVCDVCEETSDGGPYDLNTAEGLIPAHPNCRCAFVPASDQRFAHDE